jgi:hypothetical protein
MVNPSCEDAHDPAFGVWVVGQFDPLPASAMPFKHVESSRTLLSMITSVGGPTFASRLGFTARSQDVSATPELVEHAVLPVSLGHFQTDGTPILADLLGFRR